MLPEIWPPGIKRQVSLCCEGAIAASGEADMPDEDRASGGNGQILEEGDLKISSTVHLESTIDSLPPHLLAHILSIAGFWQCSKKEKQTSEDYLDQGEEDHQQEEETIVDENNFFDQEEFQNYEEDCLYDTPEATKKPIWLCGSSVCFYWRSIMLDPGVLSLSLCGTLGVKDAFMACVLEGHAPLVEIMLKAHGVDVVMQNQAVVSEVTPLCVAAHQGHLEVLEALLAAGAQVDLTGNGYTPLYLASCQGHSEVVQALLKAGAKVDHVGYDSTPLHVASCKGYLEVVQILLTAGAQVDLQSAENFETPLHTACCEGHIEVVETLLAAGAQVDLGGLDGTPLALASGRGHLEVVEILLASGAQVDLFGREGTPLTLASRIGDLEVVNALLAAGAQVDLAGHNLGTAGTPLNWASWRGHLEVVQALLAAGAQVNFADVHDDLEIDDGTPLYYAAWGGHLEVVQTLIAAGAQVDLAVRCKFGLSTPLYRAYDMYCWAPQPGHVKVLEALLDAGAQGTLMPTKYAWILKELAAK